MGEGPGHPIDAGQRNKGLEIALPITVGNNVWIGTQVSVLPGVTIGDNTVIAAGNPCRVIRNITEDDKKKYPVFE